MQLCRPRKRDEWALCKLCTFFHAYAWVNLVFNKANFYEFSPTVKFLKLFIFHLFDAVYLKPFHPSVAFHIESSHLICWSNQMTGFYVKLTLSWNEFRKSVLGLVLVAFRKIKPKKKSFSFVITVRFWAVLRILSPTKGWCFHHLETCLLISDIGITINSITKGMNQKKISVSILYFLTKKTPVTFDFRGGKKKFID